MPLHLLALLTRTWHNPKAGVYDNVFDDLDTTPVHPYHYTDPVDISPDEPYASYTSGAPTSLAYDGTCNPMPGWSPTFNPSTSEGCHLVRMQIAPMRTSRCACESLSSVC